jgi:hypothetical protein
MPCDTIDEPVRDEAKLICIQYYQASVPETDEVFTLLPEAFRYSKNFGIASPEGRTSF